jgi:hypothetical protein
MWWTQFCGGGGGVHDRVVWVQQGPLQLTHDNVKYSKYVSLYIQLQCCHVVLAVMWISVIYKCLSLRL